MKPPLTVPIERLHIAPLEFDEVFEPVALDLVDEEYEFDTPVRLKAKFELIGQDILAQGHITTSAVTPCVRCLAPTRVEFNVPITETWFHATPEEREEEETTGEHIPVERTYSGDEIDVADDLREMIMCELPERVYCAEDCKGLCAGCGANLNTEACRCAPATPEPEAEKMPEWKKALKNLKLP